MGSATSFLLRLTFPISGWLRQRDRQQLAPENADWSLYCLAV